MKSVADKADIPARASRVIVTRVTAANRTVCVPVNQRGNSLGSPVSRLTQTCIVHHMDTIL